VDPAPPFEVVETATGRIYRLPPRRLGPLRAFAGCPLVLAIGVAALLVNYYLTRAARGPLDEWAWAMFLFTGLGWSRACYTLFSLAAVIWCGRAEIEVADDGRLWATDRAGWFRVRWAKLKPGAVRRLVISEFAKIPDEHGKPGAPLRALWSLRAETEHGWRAWLALAHPREVLAPLADELANRLALSGPAPGANPDTGEPLPVVALALVPVVVEEPEVPSRDILEQPATSIIALERHPDGITVTVPPRGIWRASGGLVVLGVVFSLVGTACVLSLIERLMRANARGFGGEVIGVVFLVVGICVVLTCYHFGRKRSVLAVVGDRLLTFETGPFGSRRREFSRVELLDIACGPSNVSVNNKPLPQLQILRTTDKLPVGLLTGYDEAELRWLATVLRQSLGIPSEAPQHRKLAPDPAKPWK
jgi:hypothetical protein